jgi:hypothetical protein
LQFFWPIWSGKSNQSDWSTILIYIDSLIASLCRSHRVDTFSYLIYLNQTPDEKVMGFKSF